VTLSLQVEKLASVHYGDLIVPSEAEIEAAKRENERGWWLLTAPHVSPQSLLFTAKARRIVVPPDTYVADFARLINNKDLSDVIFIVEKQQVYGHKQILAG
jgi:hypothetical protein